MALREALAENLKKARKEKGWSQEALAFEANIDRSYVSLLERAKFNASLKMVEQLAKAFNVDPLTLLTKPPKRR